MFKGNRKRKLEKEEQTMVDWEQENYFPDKIRNKMESMWEIPQIFHFLNLAKDALNIPHLSMYEMERMLLMPRASKQLANIMTSLLSSPITKSKLRKIPPMPYEFWTNILAYKMKTWFKVYEGRRRDAVKVLESIGVEPEFWNVFPDAPLLNGKDFEELSFKQKVWLLKTVCDTAMHTRKTVQEELSKQPWEDQFETLLGTDRYGTRYIYFPQFLKTDLRVYRHCLDNKILSTVKPVKTEAKPCPDNKQAKQTDLMWKKIKERKRKLRWCHGLPSKPKKKVNKCNDKDLNDCKCISDSARDSFINEDTNLSSTSTCSNNNNSNSNNNNINLDTINGKRSRSLSKCSELTMQSDKTQCNNFKSTSGYATRSSRATVSDNESSQKMFKGFSSSSNDKCKIEIISNILSDLKSEKIVNNVNKVDGTIPSENELETNSMEKYLKPVDQCIDEPESLSNLSKTDDEKLHEIVSANCLDTDNQNSCNFQISTTSKSDDEKLSETRINQSITEKTDASLEIEHSKEGIIKENGHLGEEKPNNLVDKNTETKLLGKTIESTDNNVLESDDDKDLSLSELRSRLQKEAMEEDFSMDEDSESEYNFKNMRNTNTEVWKQEVQDFNEMLSELSVSNFQLIADSVSSFRDLVTTLSQKCGKLAAGTASNDETTYPCEMKLLKRMMELLSTLEEMESVLQDSTKKARAKLQKEWTNFKRGRVEDQDSSGEGLGSNWWVLGSQGCPLPTPGDASLQTLPQPTSSSAGSKNAQIANKDCQDEFANSTEPIDTEHEECKEHQGKSSDSEAQKCEYEKSEDQGNRTTGEEKEDVSEEEEQQSRRVLRARGISSYTEQFYSDDEIEEKELDEWADVEAVYAAPSAQIGASVTNFAAKVKQGDDRNNEEDSDQDWILPSSRKRKHKRPSANRRLKSFQHKLQSIKVDELQEAAASVVAASSNATIDKDKAKSKEPPICQPKKPEVPCPPAVNNSIESCKNATENDTKETVPSTEQACKIENMESVHSELDIKDEGPIYDYPPSHPVNNYPTNVNPNYVMVKTEPNTMNYYVMQSNMVSPQTMIHPGGSNLVSNVMPQQGYYMQGSQNYIIQNPQPSYVSAQTFQPQGPQMLAPQQFMNQSSYVPYMMPAAQPQRGYMPPGHQLVNQGVPRSPSSIMPSSQPPSNRALQIRYPPVRQAQPHPNGAVIRSNVPIRGNSPRLGYPRGKVPQHQQRGMPVKIQKRKPNVVAENPSQKTTSLIVLSDSDDDIEMIITEKTGRETETTRTKATPRRNQIQKQPTVTSDSTVAKPKSAITPQIMQRMSQGGISITPVKPAQPAVQNTNTQLVVVVNETGSHYALALPNGSKLILTPEQVAQIRASNGGKLIL